MADFSDLDAGGTLLHAQDVLCRRREAEVADLELMLRWADLHGDDPREWPKWRRVSGRPSLVRVGGVGTPLVQDLPIAELAISRQAHVLATRWVMADALDLRHRLPLCWAVLRSGVAEVWLGCRIARATRDLSPAEAGYVDAALAPALAGEQASRVLELLEAKVIEANPGAHAAKVSAERARRFVSVGRVDEAGLRHVIARVEHGDAVWVDALVDRVADILASKDVAAGGEPRDRDLLRSVAFGWLARPAELLELLLAHQGEGGGEDDTADGNRDGNRDRDGDGDGEGADPSRDSADAQAGGDGDGEDTSRDQDARGDGPNTRDADDAHTDRTAGEPDRQPAGQDKEPGDAELDLGLDNHDDDREDVAGGEGEASSEAGHEAGGPGAGREPDLLRGVSQQLLALLQGQDLTRVRPKAVVYVHLHQAAVVGHGPGVARIEDGGGPRAYQHLAELLGHAHLRVQPVIDLNESVSLDAYETPQWLRERIHLIRPGDAFPHSTTVSRNVDIDHVQPFQHGPATEGEANAPPGQSGTHNSAPLARFHHRAKTHLGYRVRQLGPGTYVWRTPNNLYRLVDANGTHVLDEQSGHALLGEECRGEEVREPSVRGGGAGDGEAGAGTATTRTGIVEPLLRHTATNSPRRQADAHAPVQIIHTPGLVLDYEPAA